MENNRIERFRKQQEKQEKKSDFFLKICSKSEVRTSQHIVIEMNKNEGYIRINDDVEKIKDYEEKKTAVINLIKKSHNKKMIDMQKQLRETIEKYGIYANVEKYVDIRIEDKEYYLNFATNTSEKQSKYFISLINALFKIL
jgi:hypothetical protein